MKGMRFTIPKNCFEILNGFDNIEKLPNVDYKMVKQKYIDYCFKVIKSWQKYENITHIDDDLNERIEKILNPDYIEPSEKMLKFRTKFFTESYGGCWTFNCVSHNMYQWEMERCFQKHFTLQEILDYLDIGS